MAGRFPLLLDEHVPRPLAHALRECGWVVVHMLAGGVLAQRCRGRGQRAKMNCVVARSGHQ
jgi:hypothetical protein